MTYKTQAEHHFIKDILFPKATKDTWSSTETTLPEGSTKRRF
jgi:hypothetical protein